MQRRFHRKQQYNRHHRRPRSLHGDNSPRNISIVDVESHTLWHRMFQNMPPREIVEEINRVWIDPDYKLILTRKE